MLSKFCNSKDGELLTTDMRKRDRDQRLDFQPQIDQVVEWFIRDSQFGETRLAFFQDHLRKTLRAAIASEIDDPTPARMTATELKEAESDVIAKRLNQFDPHILGFAAKRMTGSDDPIESSGDHPSKRSKDVPASSAGSGKPESDASGNDPKRSTSAKRLKEASGGSAPAMAAGTVASGSSTRDSSAHELRVKLDIKRDMRHHHWSDSARDASHDRVHETDKVISKVCDLTANDHVGVAIDCSICERQFSAADLMPMNTGCPDWSQHIRVCFQCARDETPSSVLHKPDVQTAMTQQDAHINDDGEAEGQRLTVDEPLHRGTMWNLQYIGSATDNTLGTDTIYED